MKAVFFECGSRYSHYQLFNFLSGEWFDISEADFDNEVVRYRSLFDMTYNNRALYLTCHDHHLFSD